MNKATMGWFRQALIRRRIPIPFSPLSLQRRRELGMPEADLAPRFFSSTDQILGATSNDVSLFRTPMRSGAASVRQTAWDFDGGTATFLKGPSGIELQSFGSVEFGEISVEGSQRKVAGFPRCF